MTDFLNSIKADLLDRRLLPIVALVGVCLVAAIAYAVLGGSSGSGSPSAVASTAPTTPAGLSVDAATPETAVAETPDGVSEQHGGHAHDPFSALPGAAAAAAAAAAKATSGTAGASGGSGSGSSGSSSESASKTETSGSTSTEETKKSGSTTKKSKSKAYDVAIEFGVLPAGATPQDAHLTPYEALKLQTPLPSADHALLVFRGVTNKAKSATFTLVGEAILHGVGSCLPSASQCQALDLKPGDTEQLEYLQPNGESIVYELRVIGISAAKGASAASVKGKWAESKAGVELLSRSGLVALPFLRYSSTPGVLVFPQHGAFSSRAHASWRHRRR